MVFLRWHYPDQVLWVGGIASALSARPSELPILRKFQVANVTPDSQWIISTPVGAQLSAQLGALAAWGCHERRSSLQCFAMGTPDNGPRDNFVRSVSRPSAQINLALSCLYIAAESTPGLDVPLYMGRISEITERIRQKVQSQMSLFDSLYTLNDLMFDELGMRGNAGNYYDIRNSLLNEVLDRKLGIPISLSILYMEVGSRIGIPMSGVNMSGHFMLSAGEGDSLIYVDPFRHGRLYSRWECLRLLSGLGDPPHDSNKLDGLERTYLPKADSKFILARVLNNMKMIHTQTSEFGAAIADAERIHYLMPWNWRNVGDIAHLYGRSGHARDAYDMLARMVQMMPPHEDVSLQLDSLEMLKPLAENYVFVDPEKIHEIPFFRI